MKSAGRLNFRLKLRLYPHQVLRENKMATGAGADRVQDGMRGAFGKAVGTAARVSTDQRVFTVYVNPLNFLKAKEALRRASMKVPPPCRVVVDEGREPVSYTHLRAHETRHDLVCRLLLEKKKKKKKYN